VSRYTLYRWLRVAINEGDQPATLYMKLYSCSRTKMFNRCCHLSKRDPKVTSAHEQDIPAAVTLDM